jgi:alcohol dehydrogenase class IV
MDRSNADQLRKFVAPEFVFGTGARRLAGQYARNLGGRRVLVVTDEGVSRAGWSQQVVECLNETDLTAFVFDRVSPNPKDHEVMAGVEVFKEERCNAVVAVGGGSPMDCAKGIGIISSNGGHISDFEGVDQVERACPPLIFVPTTAGTSADVSQFCIITNTVASYKMAIVSKAVVPDVSLVDPETTTTMDRELTAATGMDALAHAAEALASNACSPITDLHALEAAHLVAQHLLGALARPQSVEHRAGMMLASLQAGLAFSNASLGAVHAMAHSLGGLKDLPHGLCNAILLPHVMEYNFDEAREAYLRLGQAMGIALEDLDREAQQSAILSSIRRLQEAAGVNRSLRDLGIDPGDVPALAAKALQDACIVTNPRRPVQSDLEAIYAKAA